MKKRPSKKTKTRKLKLALTFFFNFETRYDDAHDRYAAGNLARQGGETQSSVT